MSRRKKMNMREFLVAKDFRMLGNSNNGVIYDIFFTEKFTVDRAAHHHFINCRFVEFDVRNSKINELAFDNCIIEKATIAIDRMVRIPKIVFNNCIIVDLDIKTDAESSNSISITGGFLKQLTIDGHRDYKMSLNSVKYRNIQITGALDALQVDDCTDGSRNGNIITFDGTCRYTRFESGSLGSVAMQARQSGIFVVESCRIKQLAITHEHLCPPQGRDFDNIEINDGIVVNILLKNIRVSKIAIGGLLEKPLRGQPEIGPAKVYLDNVKFDIAEISNTRMNQLGLKNIKTDAGEHKLFLSNLLIKYFFIDRCILDSTEFDNVNLHYARIEIGESSLVNSVVHSIKWPRDFRIYPLYFAPYLAENNYRDLRETYRQLKVLSLRADNKIDAKFFLSNELESHYRLLTVVVFGIFGDNVVVRKFPINLLTPVYGLILVIILPVLWTIERVTFSRLDSITKLRRKFIEKFLDFGDWILLHTNAVFSQFGKSILRPLFYLLFFHTIFFYLLIKKFGGQIGIQLTTLSQNDPEVFKKGLSIYLNLLSPVHGGTVPSITSSPIEVSIYSVIDFLMRLSASYFIYYFIRATRKFNYSV